MAENPKNEIRVLECLKRLPPCEHVIELLDVVYESSTTHLVFPLISEGRDLEQIHSFFGGGPLPGGRENARALFQQICRGVRHCHDNSIAHRDLSLENILVDCSGGSGIAVIIDFAQALLLDQALEPVLDAQRALLAPAEHLQLLLCRQPTRARHVRQLGDVFVRLVVQLPQPPLPKQLVR